MEIEFSREGHQRILFAGLGLLLLLAGFGVMGRFVTPLEGDGPVLLSPERWQAARLARKARHEAQEIHADLEKLVALLDLAAPDPVEAMLLAEGVYARHRTGTSATATARQSVIFAAEIVAQHAAGSVERSIALEAVIDAMDRLEPFFVPPEATGLSTVEPDYYVMLPLIAAGSR